MRLTKLSAICAAAVLCLAGLAAPRASAIAVDGTIASFGQIDYVYFSVCQDGLVDINVLACEWGWDIDNGVPYQQDLNGDGEITELDAMMLLFVDDGSLDVSDLIGGSDDSSDLGAFADGSLNHSGGPPSTLDPYLLANLTAGNYVLAISTLVLSVEDAVAGYNTFGFFTGDYRVMITGEGVCDPVVPEPATLSLLGLGLGAAGLARRRRRKA